MNQVYTLASALIDSCPDSNHLSASIKAYPALSVPANALPGHRVVLSFTAPSEDKQMHAAFLSGLETVYAPINKHKEVTIPNHLIGTVYVVVTDDPTGVSDSSTVAGPAFVMIPFDSEGKIIG
jgi:hypothetical protein